MEEINKNLIITAKAIHNTVDFGAFEIYVILNTISDKEHIVLLRGDIKDKENIHCRIASSCVPGTALNSNSCDCSLQINKSLEIINNCNLGIFVYLNQEGRGHGLTTKIQALNFKNEGINTYEAVERLGYKADIRTYEDAVNIVKYFEPESIILLTANPNKINEFEKSAIKISKIIPLKVQISESVKLHYEEKIKRGFLK